MSAETAAVSRRDVYIAGLSMFGILLHLALRLTSVPAGVRLIPLYLVLGLGGTALVWTLGRHLLHLEFGADLLAGVAIVSAVVLGQYLVACIIVLMLSGGSTLEEYATATASSALAALAKRLPTVAHRRNGTEMQDIETSAVNVGDTLVIFPHEICPVDGTVCEGGGTMDESYLTGEPFQIQKAPGSGVISGAINGERGLVIRADRLPSDSRYARIVQVMRESEQNRPKMRRIADRLASWYTPLAILVGVAAAVASGDPNRFLAVIVIATPCPLLIAIPVAVLGAISRCARAGIIIRDAAVLEQVDQCRTFIFDKTGTLTYGQPALTNVICAPGVTENEALTLAATLEQYSRHPLSAPILQAATRAGVTLATPGHIDEKAGEGLSGSIGDHLAQITGRGKTAALELPPPGSGLECVLLVDGRFAALFQFHDEPRQEGKAFVNHLLPKHQVEKLVLLSGDREAEVRHVAGQFGITEIYSGQTPEDKVAIVRRETLAAKTLFVGDGINDAPAMLEATAGIAFGRSNEITSESAGAVLLEANLSDVDRLIHIGRRMRAIALQSAVGGMLISGCGMLLAATGYLNPMTGAIAQEAIDVLAVLNAIRAGFPRGQSTDF